MVFTVLVVGLLLDVLLVLGLIAVGVAIRVSFGRPGMKRCPQCGQSALLPVEAAHSELSLPMFHCTKCSAAFVVGLDGSYTAYPPSGQQPR